ncbi:hypothetical protein ABIB25_003022 [Nakamurella sp. UYEF19]|uniref:GAF domain-containing protein n=1 Tax=Nakamurella sp. UYEF19 TaxID=1756392 RepID=UPI003399A9A6
MDVSVRIVELASVDNNRDLPGPELLPSRLMRACAQVLPVAAAGMSYFSGFRHRVPLGASDDHAVLAERLQFTVGEGPCLAAHVQDSAVLATADIMRQRWPTFSAELVMKTPYRAILSLPVDNEDFGGNAAVDLYYTELQPAITDDALQAVQEVTDVVGSLLATHSGLSDGRGQPVWLNTAAARARSRVWIAMGMVDIALSMGPRDSLALLRGHAYTHDATVDDIAGAIADGELLVQALVD